MFLKVNKIKRDKNIQEGWSFFNNIKGRGYLYNFIVILNYILESP